MDNQEAIDVLIQDLNLSDDRADRFGLLVDYLNQLADQNFTQLISLLYRMDINEDLIKQTLNSNPDKNAGELIAWLMIDRQNRKIKSRQEYSRDNNIDEDEKW